MPELDTGEILITSARRIRAACPDGAESAMRALRGATPPNWTLEWYLPWWLAECFGLDTDLAHELVVGNVLGLVSVRLHDDVLDGDVDEDVEGARRAADVLFDEALVVYRSRFPPESRFWAFLARTMAEWRAASASDVGPSDPEATRDHGVRMAGRGAPLKIGAYASCLLAEREEETWPVLERCLDHALTALVLYDQFCDWEADLAAGRWNAFVSSVSPEAQDPAHRERNRRTVLVAMMTDGAASRQFGRIHAEALAAATLAAAAECAPLAGYLTDYARRTAEQGATVEAHYRDAARRATALIFGRTLGGADAPGAEAP